DAAVGKAGAKGEGGFVVFSGVLRRARDLRTTVDAGRWGTNVSCHWPARFLRNGSAGVSQIVRVNEAAPAHGSDGGRSAEDIAAADIAYHACLRVGVGPQPGPNVLFCAKPSLLCSQDLLVGLRLRGGTRRLRDRAHNAPARQVDLEGVVPEALGVAQNEIRGLGERRLAGRLSPKLSFGLCVAPRLMCDAAKRKTRLLDGVAVKLEANRDRYQRECIGEPIAHFEIRVVRLEAPRRQLDRRNELVGLEVGVAL